MKMLTRRGLGTKNFIFQYNIMQNIQFRVTFLVKFWKLCFLVKLWKYELNTFPIYSLYFGYVLNADSSWCELTALGTMYIPSVYIIIYRGVQKQVYSGKKRKKRITFTAFIIQTNKCCINKYSRMSVIRTPVIRTRRSTEH